MSSISVADFPGLAENATVYGLFESIARSKYPMSTNPDKCSDNITDTTKKLFSCEKGSGHDVALNGIIVQFDLTLSNKCWVEAERYHFLEFVSSQSTMHRIIQMDPAAQCNEFVDKRIKEVLKEKISVYDKQPTEDNYMGILYNVPAGFRLTAGMTTNYRQLKTIYSQRKNHRLKEWRDFCHWIETLPGFRVLVLGEPAPDESEWKKLSMEEV